MAIGAAGVVKSRRQAYLDLLNHAELFCDAFAQKSDQLHESALSLTREGKDKLEDIKQKLRNLEERSAVRQLEARHRKEEVEATKRMIEQEQDTCKSLEKRIEKFLERRRLGNLVLEDSKGIEERLQSQHKKFKMHQEVIFWYNKYLGLRIEFTSAIKFIFSKIDPKSPDQEFSFTIRLDKRTNKYAMLDCLPYLKRSTDLLDDLNISNEFFEFVRSMRLEFENLVNQAN